MVFTILLLFIILYSEMDAKRAARVSSRRLNIMFQRERDLRNEIGNLNDRIQQIKSAPLNENDLRELKHRRLKKPAVDLLRDLVSHENLLPDRGAMGGRSGYYDPVASHVVNGRWLLGVFWNGNSLRGEALLQYKVSEPGKISWKLLDASWQSIDGRAGEILTR
jgi:hypothetical protein